MAITQSVLTDLIRQSEDRLSQLEALYNQIPDTRCKRKALCCKMLPDATLIEAVTVFGQMTAMDAEQRCEISRRMVAYFIVNPIRMTACPFLEGDDCRIYPYRFFGCRAYGLWSDSHYRDLARRDHETKAHLQRQWQKLGVTLPDEVVSFRQPYCTDVETMAGVKVADDGLESVSERIDALSSEFSEWHDVYRDRYFSDISFLYASVVFGIPEALQMKVSIVKTILDTGDESRLSMAARQLPDILTRPST